MLEKRTMGDFLLAVFVFCKHYFFSTPKTMEKMEDMPPKP